MLSMYGILLKKLTFNIRVLVPFCQKSNALRVWKTEKISLVSPQCYKASKSCTNFKFLVEKNLENCKLCRNKFLITESLSNWDHQREPPTSTMYNLLPVFPNVTNLEKSFWILKINSITTMKENWKIHSTFQAILTMSFWENWCSVMKTLFHAFVYKQKAVAHSLELWSFSP